MSILFGHPSGNPNSFQAALAHYETGRLEAFCIPWIPSESCLKLLHSMPILTSMVGRLARRHFHSIAKAPLVQGRMGEWRRLIMRAAGKGGEGSSYEANDWLMSTMTREIHRSAVTAVHAYEDCSLWQFEEAKRLGKGCIYDMPIGYYPAWEKTQIELAQTYAEWLPSGGLPSSQWVRPKQKQKEMELADLVLAPSAFVEGTIRKFYPKKPIAVAPYGVDSVAWYPPEYRSPGETLTLMFAGQCSLRKGIPLLIDAWRAATLPSAKLILVGTWQLSDAKLSSLPRDINWLPPQPRDTLRSLYQSADLFVLPTYFEGRALVVGEALASGLPVLTTPASGVEDLVGETTGRLFPTGDFDALVEVLRWFSDHRDALPAMRMASRAAAVRCTWENYRRHVSAAVTPFV